MTSGTIETCKSGPKVAVLNSQNDREGLGPIETINSGPYCGCFECENHR